MDLNVAGKEAWRIMCHNGVHVGQHARGAVVKCCYSVGPWTPTGSKGQEFKTMLCAPVGVIATDSAGAVKIIPWSNIYEVDLVPEAAAKPLKAAK